MQFVWCEQPFFLYAEKIQSEELDSMKDLKVLMTLYLYIWKLFF